MTMTVMQMMVRSRHSITQKCSKRKLRPFGYALLSSRAYDLRYVRAKSEHLLSAGFLFGVGYVFRR